MLSAGLHRLKCGLHDPCVLSECSMQDMYGFTQSRPLNTSIEYLLAAPYLASSLLPPPLPSPLLGPTTLNSLTLENPRPIPLSFAEDLVLLW